MNVPSGYLPLAAALPAPRVSAGNHLPFSDPKDVWIGALAITMLRPCSHIAAWGAPRRQASFAAFRRMISGARFCGMLPQNPGRR
jgi:hypothetical protein